MRAQVTGPGSRRSAIAAAGVLAALVTGCSSGPGAAPPPSPRQVIEMAASTAGTVNSFTATISLHLTPTGSSPTVQPVTMDGTMAERTHPSPLLARVDFARFITAGQSLPGGLSEIVTSRAIYLKLAMFSQLLHTGKPWIGLPASALSASSGFNLNSLLHQLDTSSPLAQARLLADAKHVTAVGTGTVAGVQVTEYTGTYSLATALARLPASLRGSMGAAFKHADAATGTVAFRVWIDGGHLVRKEVATLTTSAFTEHLTTIVTSVNQPVTITAPPASQVYTLNPAQLGSATG